MKERKIVEDTSGLKARLTRSDDEQRPINRRSDGRRCSRLSRTTFSWMDGWTLGCWKNLERMEERRENIHN